MKSIAPHLFIVVAVSFIALTLRCSTIQVTVGAGGSAGDVSIRGQLYTSSTTTSPAKKRQQKVAEAVVIVRSRDFFPKITELEFTDTVSNALYGPKQTDDNGMYHFDSIPRGMYIIEAKSDDGKVVYIDSVNTAADTLSESDTLFLEPDTLEKDGGIHGTISPPDDSIRVYIVVLGLDTFVRVNADGSFTIDNLPRGDLRFQFVTSLDTQKPLGMLTVKTLSDTTVNLEDTLYGITYRADDDAVGAVPVDGRRYITGEPITIIGNVGKMKKSDSTFIGWNVKKDGSGRIYNPGDTLIMGGANVTLYAQWTTLATVTVTFDANDCDNGDVPGPVDYVTGTIVTVPGNNGNLVKKGYTFIGWNTKRDGSGIGYRFGAVFAIGSADMTLYAWWTNRPTFSVTYHDNGGTAGSVPVDENRYETGAAAVVAGNIGMLTKKDAVFTGWNTEKDGSGTDHAPGEIFALEKSDKVLYAQWGSEPTYRIFYYGNGHTGGSVPADTSRYTKGVKVPILDGDRLVKNGATFSGWNISPDGDGENHAIDDTITIGTADVSLFARWTEEPTYTVSYDGNANTGGEVPIDVNRYLEGAAVTVRANSGDLTRKGWTFTGWSTDPDGGGTRYEPGVTFAMGDDTVTLYAVWTIDLYAVVFDAQGGTEVERQMVDYGNRIDEPFEPIRIGYTFDGWFAESVATNKWTFATDSIVRDTMLFAKWTAVRCTVAYEGNAHSTGQPSAAFEYDYGDTVQIAKTTDMLRIRYIFTGWNTEKNGAGKTYRPGEKFIIESVNLLLYAQWAPAGMARIPSQGKSTLVAEGIGSAFTVTFTYDFWMDTTEVTQADFRSTMATAYSGYEASWTTERGAGDDYPVYNVTWYDAAAYCNARSKAADLDTVYIDTAGTLSGRCRQDMGCTPTGTEEYVINYDAVGFRLPVEAEQEFACRAGMPFDYYTNSYSIDDYVWYSEISDGTTHPVAHKLPNAFNLYDMVGNVWEWCNDWYYVTIPAVSPESRVDWRGPTDRSTGNRDRVMSGGGASAVMAEFQRYEVYHGRCYTLSSKWDFGFRCVLQIPSDN